MTLETGPGQNHVAGSFPTDRKVLVGYDGSPAAEHALRWAADEAEMRHHRIVVVHCWLEAPAATPAAQAFQQEVSEMIATHGRTLLETAAHRLMESHNHVPRETLLLHGDPGPSLTSRAGRGDLLVVGRHAKGRITEFLLGSVSSYCLRHALCPVVVIPPDEDPADPPPSGP